jgi:hypothetical protein
MADFAAAPIIQTFILTPNSATDLMPIREFEFRKPGSASLSNSSIALRLRLQRWMNRP